MQGEGGRGTRNRGRDTGRWGQVIEEWILEEKDKGYRKRGISDRGLDPQEEKTRDTGSGGQVIEDGYRKKRTRDTGYGGQVKEDGYRKKRTRDTGNGGI
jgi:hypothetical protein